MGLLKYQTLTISTTAAGDLTTAIGKYSTYSVNGCLRHIVCTTSTGATASTGTVGTTGVIVFQGEKTGFKWLAIPMPAAGFTIEPRIRCYSTSGGLIGVGTTDAYEWFEFPVFCDERIVVATSGGTSASCTGGFTYNLLFAIEGAQREG